MSLREELIKAVLLELTVSAFMLIKIDFRLESGKFE